jgi:hypothetical protein
MVWGLVRIAIFTTAFLIGLLFSGSGGSPAAPKVEHLHAIPGAVQLKCLQSKPNVLRSVRM